jgi:hypothetical protein
VETLEVLSLGYDEVIYRINDFYCVCDDVWQLQKEWGWRAKAGRYDCDAEGYANL